MTRKHSTDLAPGCATFHRHRKEFQDYLPLVQQAQQDLKSDINDLRAQEGWDDTTARGVDDWASDTNTIWRVLRRHRYDLAKTHQSLLTLLAKRLTLQLHDRLPAFPPYSNSSLFYLLPLPRHTDRLGRPIVVLTLRQVLRDEHGKMDDMKAWSWWALEMVRRALHDYWDDRAWNEKGQEPRGGRGGEGCVILVDAGGSSYRNLEVELLPTLLSVGHNHFPGVFDAVYVVNAGWTHRSMWAVVKKVLPKSALEKIAFLNKPKDVDGVFDLDRLPQELGGRDPLSFASSGNPILHRYSHRPLGSPLSRQSSRSASSSSIADVYYSAQNTPSSSRRQSLTGGGVLQMTTSEQERAKSNVDLPIRSEDLDSPFDSVTPRPTKGEAPLSRQSSRNEGPMQRIKSLSDFHLYLSPSRLANIDLLNDSDEEDAPSIPPPPPKRQLRPAILDVKGSSIAARRRQRPPLQLSGKLGSDDVRSYSDRLQLHHAQVLDTYRPDTMTEDIAARHIVSPPSAVDLPPVAVASSPPPPLSPEPTLVADEPGSEREPLEDASDNSLSRAQPISAFATDANPWYGYPAVRSGTTVRPRYDRRRKRDLVKTLLFLFILRIQSWRDAFERWLGLNKLGTWGRLAYDRPSDPATGLVSSSGSGRSGDMVKQTTEKDWIWAVITFLLLRGTWTRILAAPLEAVGLSAVKDVLGLV